MTFLLVLVLIPGVGRQINGSKRWLSMAGLSFQPSEFTKYLIPATFIELLVEQNQRAFSLKLFFRVLAIIALPVLLILLEPDNGTVAFIGATVVMLFFLTKIPFKYWVVPIVLLMTIGGISAYKLPYVSARLHVYLHPELDILGKGHQPHQAKIAAGSGQLWGKGAGNSWQKLSYLPEAQNDYIAAIYAEEFGFLGMILLISCYTILACLGFSIASQSPDIQGFALAGAITFVICFQAFLNLGVVSGLLPSTGLNLPFFSQGGTSLVANMAGIGLLLSILKEEKYG